MRNRAVQAACADPALRVAPTPHARGAIGDPRGEAQWSARRERPARAAAVITGASVLLVVLGGCTYTLPKYLAPTVRETSTAGQASCNTVPPKGASEAAKAYAAAVNAATPAWTAVDATIASEGNITHRNDLLSQVNADAPFLTALRAINFPPKAAPAAKDLIAAIQAYDDFLMTSYTTTATWRSTWRTTRTSTTTAP
jgi:hypothetical protein